MKLGPVPCFIMCVMAARSGEALAQFVPPGELDEQRRVEEVVDAAVDSAMREFDVPGAVVAVVKGGRLLLAKGYGFADLETRRRVLAGGTVFRVGSLSNPVTATAVMQLVEQGRLDPAADVNRYLRRFHVDSRFARPVTIANLLTHTAGFDVSLVRTAAPTEEEVLPLGDYLARDLPPRVRPPGKILAYSNHGYTLLGYLVEISSGRPFPDYVVENVLRPLGMTMSGFRLAGALARDAATGYEPSPYGPRRAAPIHPNIVPAASFDTTATDMARFMLAHLKEDGPGPTPLLSPRALEAMHRRQFTVDPGLPGMTYGFFEGVENGERFLYHGGGLRGFMSGLYLWPERKLGLFVSNNGSSVDLVWRVFHRFVDACVPATRTPPEEIAGAAADAARVAGTYRLANHPRLNLESAGALSGGDLDVIAGADGGLSFFGQRYVETAPLRYREGARGTPAVFVQDGRGRVRYMLTTDPFFGIETWERLPWYGGGSLNAALLGLMIVAFLSAPLFGRSRRAAPGLIDGDPAPERVPRPARGAALLACGLHLLFVVLMIVAYRLSRDTGLLYGVPPLVRLALAIPLAGALPTAVMAGCCCAAWKRGRWRIAGRLHYLALTMAAVGFLLFLFRWNLLGYRF